MRRSSSRPTRCSRGLLALALAAALWLSAAPARAETTAFTFFEGTQYPLTAFFLKGEVDGPTVMVQGGIQGDEPSGYVTAQVLTHARVLRGNLIVVPRANVPSINLHLRAVNVDMNRRFDQDYNRFYEDRLARVVRFLLSQCDALIHLHEGSGFYNPTYVDSLRNPQRYGQSIIVDALTYGDDIRLGDTVKRVLDELNPGIQPPNWRFNLFNTETFNSDSKHLEQRKSLTFYALSSLKIPALAVEVSKNITQLDWKVTRQLEATVVLLKQYGVEVAPPGLTAQELEDHLAQAGRVRINGRELPAGGVVDLMPGSPISVEPETRSDDPL
ncbi:MAG: M99 family carboxypeptidase catalytic domain-containing protein, partial [Desulfovibrionaceae bacterium]